MGLFDVFKKKAALAEPEAPATPAPVSAEAGAGVLCAPVTGRLIAMADVPDPVFSSGALGRGCAIWPETDVVCAPLTGTVAATMGHAVGITGEDGVEVLVHVGVDTVEMEGRGFTGYVAQGDHVSAGQPVLGIDRAAIAEAGHPDCVVLVVSNSGDFADVALCAEAAHVDAGAAVVRVTRG